MPSPEFDTCYRRSSDYAYAFRAGPLPAVHHAGPCAPLEPLPHRFGNNALRPWAHSLFASSGSYRTRRGQCSCAHREAGGDARRLGRLGIVWLRDRVPGLGHSEGDPHPFRNRGACARNRVHIHTHGDHVHAHPASSPAGSSAASSRSVVTFWSLFIILCSALASRSFRFSSFRQPRSLGPRAIDGRHFRPPYHRLMVAVTIWHSQDLRISILDGWSAGRTPWPERLSLCRVLPYFSLGCS